MPQARPARRTKSTDVHGKDVRGGAACQTPPLHWRHEIEPLLVRFRNGAGCPSGGNPVHGWWVMGHLFVPAALLLWVGVAVVRMWAAPDPTPAATVQEQARQR